MTLSLSKVPMICSCISPYSLSSIILLAAYVTLILKLITSVLLTKSPNTTSKEPKSKSPSDKVQRILCYNTKHMKNWFTWSNLKFPFPDMEWDRKRVLGSWDGGRLDLIYGLKAFLFKFFHTKCQLHGKKYICTKCWRWESLNKPALGIPDLGRKVIRPKLSKQFFFFGVVTPAPGKFCRTSCASSQSDLHFLFLLSE